MSSSRLRTTLTIAVLVAIPSVATFGRDLRHDGSSAPSLYRTLRSAVDLARMRDGGVGIPSASYRCDVLVHVVEALVDPVALPDRDGELIRVARSLGAGEMPDASATITLRDWQLVGPRRRQRLEELVLTGTTPSTIGRSEGLVRLRIPLSNRAGWIALVDPCGVEQSRLTWGRDGLGRPKPGHWVTRPGHDGPIRGMHGTRPAQERPEVARGVVNTSLKRPRKRD